MSKNAMIGGIVCGLAGMDTKFVGVVGEITSRLNTEGAPIYRERFLKGARQPLPKGKPVVYRFLQPIPQKVLQSFNPDVYKNNNTKDIWVSEKFIENILSVAEVFQPTEDLPIPTGFNLIQDANDKEIDSELPQDHVFGASEFCWRLYQMTRAQPNGSGDTLLTNGRANIFDVVGKGGGVFAVYVFWRSGHRQWFFYCYSLVEGGWFQGYRGFSRN